MSAYEPKGLSLSGIHLRFVDVGSGDPALVFIHYWGGTHRTWRLVIDELAPKHRCVALDLRGWGGSDRGGEDFGLQAQADDVLSLIGRLGLKRYVVVGHSMGGKIAQIVAARAPSGLAGLVLVAPAPPTALPVPESQRRMILESYQSREGVEMALSVLSERGLSAELQEQVIEDTLGGAPGAKRAWTESGMTSDITAAVSSIKVPTVVIVGNADRVETEDALRKELGTRIPSARFVVLQGVGHLSPLEAPREVAAAVSDTVGGWSVQVKPSR